MATFAGTSGTSSDMITISDLDGDGRQDIVISDYAGGTIYLYRNTTSGGILSFAAPVVHSMGEDLEQKYTVIADFDGDGKPDLAIGSDGDLLVFPNTSTPGNLSLGPVIDVSAGNHTRGMAVGDIDGDGKPDLAVINSVANTVTVLANASTPGKIAFGPSQVYGVVTFPQTVAIQDLDHDSKPELIVAGYSGGFSVLHNAVGGLMLSSFTPAAAGNSDTLTLRGANFTGATAVYIGGYAAYSFTVLSDSVIRAVINTAANGDVSVVTPEGTASMAGFVYLPSPYILVSGTTRFCQGDSTLLSSNIPGIGQWYKDSIAIPGATNPQLTANVGGSYTFTILIDGYPRTTLPVQIQVDANPPKPIITLDGGNTLRSSAIVGNQWYVGNIMIAGASSVSYQPDSTGNYSVKVTSGNCSTSSDVYPFVKPVSNGTGNVQVVPNPAGSYIQVYFDAPLGDMVVAKITDLRGNLLIQVNNIQNGQTIPIGRLKAGEYVLRLISSSGKVNETVLFTKL